MFVSQVDSKLNISFINFPSIAIVSLPFLPQFTQASYNVALDEARRCLGHHQLTALLHKLAANDPAKTGYVPAGLVTAALAQELSESK